MSHATAGDGNYKAKIAIAFKERLLKDNGGNGPRWVDYEHLTLTKLRDVNAAKKTAAKRSPSSPRVVAQAANAPDDAHDDVGEGGCGCECKACDDNIRHCGNRSRGCKH